MGDGAGQREGAHQPGQRGQRVQDGEAGGGGGGGGVGGGGGLPEIHQEQLRHGGAEAFQPHEGEAATVSSQ